MVTDLLLHRRRHETKKIPARSKHCCFTLTFHQKLFLNHLGKCVIDWAFCGLSDACLIAKCYVQSVWVQMVNVVSHTSLTKSNQRLAPLQPENFNKCFLCTTFWSGRVHKFEEMQGNPTAHILSVNAKPMWHWTADANVQKDKWTGLLAFSLFIVIEKQLELLPNNLAAGWGSMFLTQCSCPSQIV